MSNVELKLSGTLKTQLRGFHQTFVKSMFNRIMLSISDIRCHDQKKQCDIKTPNISRVTSNQYRQKSVRKKISTEKDQRRKCSKRDSTEGDVDASSPPFFRVHQNFSVWSHKKTLSKFIYLIMKQIYIRHGKHLHLW